MGITSRGCFYILEGTGTYKKTARITEVTRAVYFIYLFSLT